MLFGDSDLDDNTQRVIVINCEEWEAAGYPPTYRYVLSRGGVLAEDRATLSPWIQEFVGISIRDARRLLAARWEPFLAGPCDMLARYFMRFQPHSIMTWSGMSWLICRANKTKTTAPKGLMITAPFSRQYIEQNMKLHGIVSDEFADIASLLCGVRELPPPHATFFLQFSESDSWKVLTEKSIDHLDEPAWFKERWKGGVIVFNACGGEMLVRNVMGAYAWVTHGGKLPIYCRSDREFIKALHVFHSRGAGWNGWGFDPYSSRDATYMLRDPGE